MLVYVRPSNEALHRARVPGAQDQHGCPLPILSPCAFCEQEGQPRVARAQKIISLHPLFCYGCATRQLCPVPRSTFKGTDNPSFFPVASISVFTRCFASSKSFSGTSKINSS